MKTILSIIAASFVVIAACMLYLVKTGVVMRSAPYIKPTTIQQDIEIVAEQSILRLFPDLQNAKFVLWGLDLNKEDQQRFLAKAQQEYERRFPHKVKLLNSAESTSEQVKDCATPCWILMPQEGAHQLEGNGFIEQNIKPLTEQYISISWIDFQNPKEVPAECIDQKYLNLFCMKWVGLNEAQRRFKDQGQRYFFMRKYLDHDYFVYVREHAQEMPAK